MQMTPAELKTLREACGLSLPQLAGLCSVQDRTARYWESGKTSVPADVEKLVRELNTSLTNSSRLAIHQITETCRLHGSAPNTTLIRYRADADLHAHRPDMIPFPASTHAALIYRVYDTLQRESIPCRIVYFELAAYQDWLIATSQTDTEAARSAWAAMMVP